MNEKEDAIARGPWRTMPDEGSLVSTAQTAALKPQELLPACIDIIQTFEPGKTTVDSHHQAYTHRHRILDPGDAKFLQQVLYGSQRYKKLLKVFLSSFYFNHAGEVQRADQTLYLVLAYLSILRLEELGFAQFAQLVLSQDFVKTRVFLKFLFSEESLTKWLKEGWLTLYEPHYVQTELIDEVMKFEPQVRALVQELERRQAMGEARKAAEVEAAMALAEGRSGPGNHTTPEPFNLTQPAPRLVPEPNQFVEVPEGPRREGTEFKARSWRRPEGLPREQKELERRFEENRRVLREKYADPRAQRFDLETEKRPSRLNAVREELSAREAEAHPFQPAAPKPVPKWDADQGFVKLNAAAILREDQVYRRKQAEEARVVKAYEEDLRDTKEYDDWVAKMRAADDAARAAEIERRRVETALADEQAKVARERTRVRKRQFVTKMKAEADASAEETGRKREAEIAARREQAAAIAQVHKKGPIAVADVEARRREAANSVREASRALEAEKKRALAEEEERRQEVIRQIRALELVPRRREHVLDPTWEAGHGLLEEMSLAELRERLALAKAREAQDRERRRAEIVRDKQDRQEHLRSKMATIASFRRLGATQAAEQRQRDRAARAEREEADRRRREEATLKLEAAREEIRSTGRAEDERLVAELKAIRVKNQFLGVNREAVQATKFRSLEKGARREAAALQQAGQDVAARDAAVQRRQRAQKKKLELAAERERSEAAEGLALRFANSAFDASLTNARDAQRRIARVATERSHKLAIKATYDELYPFSAEITEDKKREARQVRTEREAARAERMSARQPGNCVAGSRGAISQPGAAVGTSASGRSLSAGSAPGESTRFGNTGTEMATQTGVPLATTGGALADTRITQAVS